MGSWGPRAVWWHPSWLDSVSSVDLLAHVAGVRYDAERDLLVWDAGADWAYSGAGYALLQRSLEAATGQGLEQLARETLFAPLELGSMSFIRPSDRPLARGHDRSGHPLNLTPVTASNAPSSLHTSAHDYGLFLHRVARIDGEPPDSWTRMTTPVVSVRKDSMLMWGIGWALAREPDGGMIVFHWGSNPGFKSLALVDRSRRRAMVIFTNGDNGLELAGQIVRILDHRAHPFLEFYMLHPDD